MIKSRYLMSTKMPYIALFQIKKIANKLFTCAIRLKTLKRNVVYTSKKNIFAQSFLMN
jgi:hypothetical protein